MPAHDQHGTGRVASNRKALHDYHVLERLEAGIALLGTEVKSVRAGGVNLTGGFARIENGRAVLHGVHIAPYTAGNRFNHDPLRPRALLLKRRELGRLVGQLAQKGFALVPLAMYFRGPWVKVELGLCRGKTKGDQRETLRRKTAEREVRQAVARRM